MSNRGSSAIVLGASMSGLLAARAISDAFETVTLIERDVLGDGSEVRKGVPQAAHAHGLLATGYRAMEASFPGLMDDLSAAGACRGDVAGDFLWYQYGHWKLRHHSGLGGIVVSRPCLEAAIRRRVRALPRMQVLDGTAAIEPAFDAAARRVVGLTVRQPGSVSPITLPADLVIDASGRGSHSPRWLQQWGFGQTSTLTVKVDVAYETRVFRRRSGDFYGSNGGIVAGTPPASKRLAAVLAAEGDRWEVTLAGMLGDHPPPDDRGWTEFARSLPVPAVYDLVQSADPLGQAASYRFPANQRRLYERMARFPDGFLVVGDALCSFNPIYGQGMSVAAMEARALEESLAGGVDRLAARFYTRATSIVDTAWTIATGEDLRYPEVEGARSPGARFVNRYLERVHAVASEDEVVCRRFFDVLNLLDPPQALLAPSVAWRVLARRVPRSAGTPWGRVQPPAHARR